MSIVIARIVSLASLINKTKGCSVQIYCEKKVYRLQQEIFGLIPLTASVAISGNSCVGNITVSEQTPKQFLILLKSWYIDYI
jgi:hypothetical protein